MFVSLPTKFPRTTGKLRFFEIAFISALMIIANRTRKIDDARTREDVGKSWISRLTLIIHMYRRRIVSFRVLCIHHKYNST